MKQKTLLTTLLAVSLVCNEVFAPPPPTTLLISEIMYNSPESEDSLNYIELSQYYNQVNLSEASFVSGIDFVFPDSILSHGEAFLIVQDSVAFESVFGIHAMQWGPLTHLSPGTEIVLSRPFLSTRDSLIFDSIAPWPNLTNGFGYSLHRCSPYGVAHSHENWGITSSSLGIQVNDYTINGTPGEYDWSCIVADLTERGHSEVLKLYPNPNNGTFTLDFSQLQQDATLRIRNTMSQVLFERNVSRGSTSLTQNIKFNKGIYLLELDDGNDCQHQYMVVTE